MPPTQPLRLAKVFHSNKIFKRAEQREIETGRINKSTREGNRENEEETGRNSKETGKGPVSGIKLRGWASQFVFCEETENRRYLGIV